MKVIAFTGMPFSGKTEAVNVAREMNIPVIRMGDLVWDEVKKLGLEINDANVGKVANEMRIKEGMDIWARKTIEKIKKLEDVNCIVIDGIRNIEEVELFKEKLGKDFVLIAIHASPGIRIKRALARGRKDDVRSIEELKEREKRELKWGLGLVIASADIILTNESDLEEFRQKVKEVLHKVID
jgi:dephospho-CoA kinase